MVLQSNAKEIAKKVSNDNIRYYEIGRLFNNKNSLSKEDQEKKSLVTRTLCRHFISLEGSTWIASLDSIMNPGSMSCSMTSDMRKIIDKVRDSVGSEKFRSEIESLSKKFWEENIKAEEKAVTNYAFIKNRDSLFNSMVLKAIESQDEEDISSESSKDDSKIEQDLKVAKPSTDRKLCCNKECKDKSNNWSDKKDCSKKSDSCKKDTCDSKDKDKKDKNAKKDDEDDDVNDKLGGFTPDINVFDIDHFSSSQKEIKQFSVIEKKTKFHSINITLVFP